MASHSKQNVMQNWFHWVFLFLKCLSTVIIFNYLITNLKEYWTLCRILYIFPNAAVSPLSMGVPCAIPENTFILHIGSPTAGPYKAEQFSAIRSSDKNSTFSIFTCYNYKQLSKAKSQRTQHHFFAFIFSEKSKFSDDHNIKSNNTNQYTQIYCVYINSYIHVCITIRFYVVSLKSLSLTSL